MNRYLTPASLNVIKALQQSEDGELTWERGAGYWVENSRVSAAACKHLLMLCLLRETYNNNSTYIVYELSSEVAHVLTGDDYVPAILRAQRTGEPQMIPTFKPKPSRRD